MARAKPREVGATEARVRFGALVRWVADGGSMVVDRAGRPEVVAMPVEEYEQAHAGQAETEDWWELARRSREAIHLRRNGRPLPPIEDVIRDMREERDAQLLANLRRR